MLVGSLATGGVVVSGGAVELGLIGILVGLTFAKRSGKEMSSDKPGWVNRGMVDPNKTAQQNAKDILDGKYGSGNWPTGPKTEYNKIVKWITRKIFFNR